VHALEMHRRRERQRLAHFESNIERARMELLCAMQRRSALEEHRRGALQTFAVLQARREAEELDEANRLLAGRRSASPRAG
jgi:flagellar biosynthesis chaperone FliJ